MHAWTTKEIPRCLDLLDRSGDLMVCKHDSLWLQPYILVYYQNSTYIIHVTDIYDRMCASVDVGQHPPMRYQRRRSVVEGLDPPAHGNKR